MLRWLTRLGVLALVIAGALFAAVTIGGPDLIYPRVPGTSYGPSSLEFVDTDPGPTIGGAVIIGRAQDEKGVEMYIVHWGLAVEGEGHGDHGGNCKGFRDTGHVVMAPPSTPGEKITLEIPQGTKVPDNAVNLVAHTIYGGTHNLAKCFQIPIVNRVD